MDEPIPTRKVAAAAVTVSTPFVRHGECGAPGRAFPHVSNVKRAGETRTGKCRVAAQYHTARFRLVPHLAKALSVPVPPVRTPDLRREDLHPGRHDRHREAHDPQQSGSCGHRGSGAAAQQPAAQAVPAQARPGTVAGHGPGRGRGTAAADLAAVPPAGEGDPGRTAPGDGQAAALAVLFSWGHLAAALGSLRIRGPPGQLMGVAPAGLAARQRPCGLL